MKKTRLAFLLAMLMICTAVLASCGGGKKWEKVLDGSLFEKETVVSQKVSATVLDGKAFDSSAGELAIFEKEDAEDDYKTEYSVYNLLKNSVVFSATGSETKR